MIFLDSSTASGSHIVSSPSSTINPEPSEEKHGIYVLFRDDLHSFIFAPWSVKSLCTDHHLLQTEVSLIRVDRCMNV